MRYVMILLVLWPLAANAGALGRAAHSAARGAAAEARRARIESAYRRDLVRDAALPAKPLERPRRVQRYVSEQQAAAEHAAGIGAGSHFTPHVARGRGIQAETARDRYGLRESPDRVLTVELPAGTPIREAKAMGGKPGYGEVSIARPVPASAIVRDRAVAKPKSD